ncbi:hypothetical protein L6R46_08450 [Myxococcota bacterium]|nr:hypothetical protein [Myxococcota bacterium]
MAHPDDPSDPKPTPQSAPSPAAPSAAAAEVKALGRLVSEAAHSLLDGVETLLLGRVGAADDAIRESEGDPLTRLRAERALDDERRQQAQTKVMQERDARLRRAQDELARLKAGGGPSAAPAEAEPPEPKAPESKKRSL